MCTTLPYLPPGSLPTTTHHVGLFQLTLMLFDYTVAPAVYTGHHMNLPNAARLGSPSQDRSLEHKRALPLRIALSHVQLCSARYSHEVSVLTVLQACRTRPLRQRTQPNAAQCKRVKPATQQQLLRSFIGGLAAAVDVGISLRKCMTAHTCVHKHACSQ